MQRQLLGRDWLLTGLMLVAAVTVTLTVGRAIDFGANATPAPVVYVAD